MKRRALALHQNGRVGSATVPTEKAGTVARPTTAYRRSLSKSLIQQNRGKRGYPYLLSRYPNPKEVLYG